MKKIIVIVMIISYVSTTLSMEIKTSTSDLEQQLNKMQKDVNNILKTMIFMQITENNKLKLKIDEGTKSNLEKETQLLNKIKELENKNKQLETVNKKQQETIEENTRDLDSLGQAAQDWYNRLTILDKKVDDFSNENTNLVMQHKHDENSIETLIKKIVDNEFENNKLESVLNQKDKKITELEKIIKNQQKNAQLNLSQTLKYFGTSLDEYNPEKHKSLEDTWIITTQGNNDDLPKLAKVYYSSYLKDNKCWVYDWYSNFKDADKLDVNKITHILKINK